MTDTLRPMPTRTRSYHHGDLRAALLTRAEETLREKGPGALSLRELARDLGVSHAAPSRHFKDKQALLDALALSGFDRMSAVLGASLDGVPEKLPEQVEAVVRAYVGFARDNAALLDLMYSVKHDPEASDALLEATQRWSDLVLRLVAEGQARGEVREGSLEHTALPVFATLHGYADLAVSGMLPPEMDEHGLDVVIAFILRGIRL
ncbi:TetR/AcrR family transcriptional regulator [Streptomyces sp. KC 17012]|nr:TetR/AcrR family transcriptional regulator [Streptomyces plumbidurans]PTM93063.1 TetR family transcriptional regulator [Streptomyces sp. VMFN-G11Ma]